MVPIYKTTFQFSGSHRPSVNLNLTCKEADIASYDIPLKEAIHDISKARVIVTLVASDRSTLAAVCAAEIVNALKIRVTIKNADCKLSGTIAIEFMIVEDTILPDASRPRVYFYPHEFPIHTFLPKCSSAWKISESATFSGPVARNVMGIHATNYRNGISGFVTATGVLTLPGTLSDSYTFSIEYANQEKHEGKSYFWAGIFAEMAPTPLPSTSYVQTGSTQPEHETPHVLTSRQIHFKTAFASKPTIFITARKSGLHPISYAAASVREVTEKGFWLDTVGVDCEDMHGGLVGFDWVAIAH